MSPTPNPPSAPERAPRTESVPEKVRTRSYIAATLAVLLIAETIGIGLYAYYRIQRALEPENLADRVEEAVRENYPEFREELVARAHEKAPEIAQQVSRSMIAAAPGARADLERLAARQVSAGLETVTELSAEQFREVLAENRTQFIRVFESIENAPDEVGRLVLETEANIEDQLGVDLQRQAKLAVRRMDELNAKLERLAEPPETLSAKEQLERRIVRVLRAMQQHDAAMQISALPQPRR